MKTKVFIPVPVSERLPEIEGQYFFLREMEPKVKGMVMFSGDINDPLPFTDMAYDKYSADEIIKNCTHWLEERELNVFTDEELKQHEAETRKHILQQNKQQ